jgi:hypothetical protein
VCVCGGGELTGIGNPRTGLDSGGKWH